MKLANSWVEDAPTGTALGGFHDEVDEAKDGCGGVVWQPYVLKKPHTSNKMLHELAREVRGEERKRGRKFGTAQYKLIFDNWADASRPFLQPRHDYFTEFLAKLACYHSERGNVASGIRASETQGITVKGSGESQ